MVESNFDLTVFNDMVPKFDGKINDFPKFVRFGGLYYRSLNAEGKVEFELYFATRLTGKAYDLFEFGGFQTWETFVSAAREKFQKKKSTSILMLELMKVKQENNENIRAFSDRVEILKNLLNEACMEIKFENRTAVNHFRILNEQAALRAFQDGLIGEMKLLIKARNYRTLNEAIQGALEEDLYVNKLNKNDLKNEIVCYTCNEVGHLAKTCWQYSRNTNIYTEFNRNIVCFKCNRKGHYSNQCNWNQSRENRNYNRSDINSYNSINKGPLASIRERSVWNNEEIKLHNFEYLNMQRSIIRQENLRRSDPVVINIKMNCVKGGICSFLIDSGASVSVLKIGIMRKGILVDTNDILKLTGVTSGRFLTLGMVEVDMDLKRDIINQKFHLVPDDFGINFMGILGRDFLEKYKANIDFYQKKLTLCTNEGLTGINFIKESKVINCSKIEYLENVASDSNLINKIQDLQEEINKIKSNAISQENLLLKLKESNDLNNKLVQDLNKERESKVTFKTNSETCNVIEDNSCNESNKNLENEFDGTNKNNEACVETNEISSDIYDYDVFLYEDKDILDRNEILLTDLRVKENLINKSRKTHIKYSKVELLNVLKNKSQTVYNHNLNKLKLHKISRQNLIKVREKTNVKYDKKIYHKTFKAERK